MCRIHDMIGSKQQNAIMDYVYKSDVITIATAAS